jgi:hypothetical protein
MEIGFGLDFNSQVIICCGYFLLSSIGGLVYSSPHELLIFVISLRIFNAVVSPCLLHDRIKDAVGLLCTNYQPSKGFYLHSTTQHRSTNINTLSGFRTHDPSNQAAKTNALHRAATGTVVDMLMNTKFS